jgi:Trypsin-co-occurring domain 2
MSDSEIPLADVVRRLRTELQAATEAGKGKGLRFEVQDIEVEMQVVVTKGGSGEFGGEGGVKLWVIGKAGGKVSGKYESSEVQKVKFRLKPKTGKGAKSGTVDLAG